MIRDEDVAKMLFHLLSDTDMIKGPSKLESLKHYRAKKIRELAGTVRSYRERIQQGIAQALTFPILTPQEVEELKGKLSIPKDDPNFWKAFGEGQPLSTLLKIPFEMLTKIYDHAMKDINLGFSSSAINELYLLTLLEPLISQFWLGAGIASHYIDENEIASAHLIRAVMLSQSDRDAMIATLWLIDVLNAQHHTAEANQAKEIASKLISDNPALEEFRPLLAAK